MADDISQAAVTMPINAGEPEIGQGLQESGVVAKSKISGISVDGGAILSELIEKGILEEISPTEVRLSANKSLIEADIRGIARDDFEKVWGILRQSQLVNSGEDAAEDSEKDDEQPAIEEVAPIKAGESTGVQTSLGLVDLEDKAMGSAEISIEDNVDKVGPEEFVSVDKLANSESASVSVMAKDKAIGAGKINSQDNVKAKPEKDVSDKIKTEKVRELLMKAEKQIDSESSPRAGAERPGNTRISLPESSFSQPAATASPLVSSSASLPRSEATAAPPVNMTTPPINMTAPPVNMTTPPINMTAPPVNMTTPPINMTAPPVMPATYADSGTVTASEGLSSGDSEEDEGASRDNDSSSWENDDEDEENEEDDEVALESDYPQEEISEEDNCPACEKLNKKKNILEIKENISSVTDRLFRSSDKTEQKSLAKERKEKFLELMENDPQAAIDSAISGPRRRGFSADIRKDVERIGNVEGVLETEYQCDLKRGTSKTSYFIKDNGRKYEFYFSAGGPAIPLSGSRIKILNGLILDDRVALDSVSADNFKIISSKKSGDIASKQKVAVILFNFNNDKRKPFKKSEVFKMLKYLRKFIRENSYGKLDVEFSKGDIYGWYTIESNSTYCDKNDAGCVEAPKCNKSSVNKDDNWHELAKNMAKADNDHPFPDKEGAYDKIFYIYPKLYACRYNGRAVNDEILMNGNVSNYLAVHEFGHTLGFAHAQHYVCTEEENDCSSAHSTGCLEKYNKTAISNYCLVYAYGDLYDAMGYGWGHYGAFPKMKMGWISTDNMRTITADGSYEIKPIEDKSSEVQVLVIPRGERTIEIPIYEDYKMYYYVEYLREYISSEGKSEGGVVVRLASADLTRESETLLIDTIPETFYAHDAFLKKGEEFQDEIAGIRIKVNDIYSDGAEVEVKVNQASSVCLEAEPEVSLKRSASSPDCIKCGESVEYAMTITNNDGIGCSGSDFEVTSKLSKYLSQEPSSLTATIEPGDSITENIVITLSEDANSSYNIYTFREEITKLNSLFNSTYTNWIYECEGEDVESAGEDASADEPVTLLSEPFVFPPPPINITAPPVILVIPPPLINMTSPPVTPGTPLLPPINMTSPPATLGTPPPPPPINIIAPPVILVIPPPLINMTSPPVTPGTPPPPINMTAPPVTPATPPPSKSTVTTPPPLPQSAPQQKPSSGGGSKKK